MPRKKKPEFHFTPEQEAVWRASPKLTLRPKYRRVGADKVLEHIKRDNCEPMARRVGVVCGDREHRASAAFERYTTAPFYSCLIRIDRCQSFFARVLDISYAPSRTALLSQWFRERRELAVDDLKSSRFLDDFGQLNFITQAAGGTPQISLDLLGSEGYLLSFLSICLRQVIRPLGVE